MSRQFPSSHRVLTGRPVCYRRVGGLGFAWSLVTGGQVPAVYVRLLFDACRSKAKRCKLQGKSSPSLQLSSKPRSGRPRFRGGKQKTGPHCPCAAVRRAPQGPLLCIVFFWFTSAPLVFDSQQERVNNMVA